MTEAETRPTAASIKEAYDRIFNTGLSLSKVKDAAFRGRLFPSTDVIGVTGRSIAWKVFLVPNGPLQSSSLGLSLDPPLGALRISRKEYTDLLLDNLRAPDGSYEEGFIVPGSSISPERVPKLSVNLEKNNPLSLHNENPWKEWFASVELRKTIMQDVERTFPEIGYFRDPSVQVELTNVLFLYAVANPAIGYRQGMHELLAPLFYALDYDSISEDADTLADYPMVRELCSRTWVAADAWTLFQSIMRGVSSWYEWRETPTDPRLISSSSPLTSHVHLNIPDGQVDIKPFVAPIVEACNRIQSTILRTVDPLLYKSMQGAGIEPQIYGIRWLRLLFTREFSIRDAMILWDGLFACDPSFELTQWICVAMLVRIRNQLIPSDYSTQLTYLLRYPTPPSADLESGSSFHHANLLLKQALALQLSPTPSTGASLVVENWNILNIAVEVPEPLPVPMRRHPSHETRGKSASTSDGRHGSEIGGTRTTHARQQSSQQIGLPEIARGLLERGESLGINKTLMSAVSELRRNLPDLAASLVRTPQTTYAAFPLTDERPPTERPPWEPRTRFEMERDISEMRTTNKRMGEAVSWIVDVLLQDEGDVKDAGRLKDIQNKKREALESLSYVRDVLNGNVTHIDEELLVGEEELKKRKAAANLKREDARVEVALPLPVSVVNSRAPSSSHPFPLSAPPPTSFPDKSLPHIAASRTPTTASPILSASTDKKSTQLAPWNYTRSNFASTTLPVATLPRLPPPTSTSFRRPLSSTVPAVNSTPGQTSHRSEANHDPLGVL